MQKNKEPKKKNWFTRGSIIAVIVIAIIAAILAEIEYIPLIAKTSASAQFLEAIAFLVIILALAGLGFLTIIWD